MTDSPRILLVEDEAVTLVDLERILTRYGYQVVARASTGGEAVESAQAHRPDLVLMDIRLRGEMDGIEAAEKIKVAYNIPVVYMSAYADEQTLARAKETAPHAYITKPYNERVLRITLDTALSRHRLETQLLQNEKLLEATVNSIGAAVFTLNSRLKVRLANPPACNHFFSDSSCSKNFHIDNVFELEDPVTGEKPTIAELIDIMSRQTDITDVYEHEYIVSPRAETPQTEGRREYSEGLQERFQRAILRINAINSGSWNGTPVEGDEAAFVLTIRDTTELHRTELQKQVFATVIENSGEPVILCRYDGTIHHWNRGAELLFGYSQEEAEGRSFSMLLPPYQPNELPDIFERIADGVDGQEYETVAQRRNGAVREVSLSIMPIHLEQIESGLVSVFVRDITERKRLEWEATNMANRERRRIGEELHDSLGQMLTGLSFKVKALQDTYDGKSEGQETLSEAGDLVKTALKKTRELSRGLVPDGPRPQQLPNALRMLAAAMSDQYQQQVDLALEEELSFDDENVAHHLFLIAREAVYNAYQHARARKIWIELHQEDTEIILVIGDDGIGLPEAIPTGLGIQVMRYRANMIGAYFEVFSVPEGGSRVVCRLPWPKGESS
ncbi:MAG: PAS domain S-box protein [Spirochaetales bacterium]|nr:PAS domain S-box protein [Spirochaetales bacterium]MCF7938008.1 PAS domain S-box protein [Spirochaetales bacterium]